MREFIEITYIGGTTEQVTAYYPDFVAFEAKFDRNPIVVSFDQYRLTNQGYLAWSALTREKRTEASWEDWLNTVENVKILDEDTVHNPLEKNQPTGSLPD